MRVRAFVTIPAYNEAARFRRLLDELAAYLESGAAEAAGLDVHFCVVDDGSLQEQFEAEARLVRDRDFGDKVRLVRLDTNGGKGRAIQVGFHAGIAEGFDYLGFIDADGAVPVPELHRALVYLATANREAGVTGVIGSRVNMLGRTVRRNPLRHYLGRVFATFVSEWFNQAVYDTQCGLKVFERVMLRRHLDAPEDVRWVWDTQLLLAMLHAGERIHELPVDWRETGESKLSLVRDPLQMVWRLVRFRRRLRAHAKAHPPTEIA